MNISEIGLNIKKHREYKNWTLNKLKQESGVGYATLHDIESGKSQSISTSNLEKIARTLNVTANDLLGIDIVKYTVTDVSETLNLILESDELELDGVLLSKDEKGDLEDFFSIAIEKIRKRRTRLNNENSSDL